MNISNLCSPFFYHMFLLVVVINSLLIQHQLLNFLEMSQQEHLSFECNETVADPGFPVGGGGGAPSRWGVLTSDVGTFWQKCMRKRKNWILLVVVVGGGGARRRRPLDPPMRNVLKSVPLLFHM